MIGLGSKTKEAREMPISAKRSTEGVVCLASKPILTNAHDLGHSVAL